MLYKKVVKTTGNSFVCSNSALCFMVFSRVLKNLDNKLQTPPKMLAQSLILLLAISMTISAPAPHPEPNPAPVADPAAKPGLTPLVYTPPVAVSYNAFSTVQTHPSLFVKSAQAAVVPAVQTLPTVYTLQAQAAPALGYAVNYPYVVV